MGTYIDDIVLLSIFQNQATNIKEYRSVITDINGNVLNKDILLQNKNYAEPNNVLLVTPKYPNVVFYANYFNNLEDSIIYRFSSGIILDSSTETPQYKIVFASYNVKTSKVTFVEKVLSWKQ